MINLLLKDEVKKIIIKKEQKNNLNQHGLLVKLVIRVMISK